jgi:hypothetical protein
MYCNRCGKEMAAGEQFCPACGAPVANVLTTAGRVQRHITLLSSLWFVYSFFVLLAGGALLVIANTLLAQIGYRGELREMPGFLQPLLTVVAVFILVKAFVGFAAAWGLLQRESWARPLTLVLAFLALLNAPFGTALGIYSIWVLLPGSAGDEYSALVPSAN